jgi:hypothetical protein
MPFFTAMDVLMIGMGQDNPLKFSAVFPIHPPSLYNEILHRHQQSTILSDKEEKKSTSYLKKNGMFRNCYETYHFLFAMIAVFRQRGLTPSPVSPKQTLTGRAL